MGRTSALVALALTGVLGIGAPAWPQDVSAPCRLCGSSLQPPDDKPKEPVSLDVETRLDFDRLVVAGAGEGRAELGPDGTRSISGSITAIGARAMGGEGVIRRGAGLL